MDARTVNLLGALALALGDEMRAATEAGAGRPANAPAAIVTIGDDPGQTIEALSGVLDLSHSATVRLIDRLAADRLVDRRPGADGRSTALHLTAAGRRRAGAILTWRRRVLADYLALLAPAEQATLGRLLEKLLHHPSHGRRQADRICRLCEVAVCPYGSCPVEVPQ